LLSILRGVARRIELSDADGITVYHCVYRQKVEPEKSFRPRRTLPGPAAQSYGKLEQAVRMPGKHILNGKCRSQNLLIIPENSHFSG